MFSWEMLNLHFTYSVAFMVGYVEKESVLTSSEIEVLEYLPFECFETTIKIMETRPKRKPRNRVVD